MGTRPSAEKTTMTQEESNPASEDARFEELAEEEQPGLVEDFWDFIVHNKRWWLTPIIVVLLLVGALLIFASSSAAAPFIYTRF